MRKGNQNMSSVHSHFRCWNCMVVTKLKLTVGSLHLEMQLFSLYTLILNSISYAWHVQSLVHKEEQCRHLRLYANICSTPMEFLPPTSVSVATALNSWQKQRVSVVYQALVDADSFQALLLDRNFISDEQTTCFSLHSLVSKLGTQSWFLNRLSHTKAQKTRLRVLLWCLLSSSVLPHRTIYTPLSCLTDICLVCSEKNQRDATRSPVGLFWCFILPTFEGHS